MGNLVGHYLTPKNNFVGYYITITPIMLLNHVLVGNTALSALHTDLCIPIRTGRYVLLPFTDLVAINTWCMGHIPALLVTSYSLLPIQEDGPLF